MKNIVLSLCMIVLAAIIVVPNLNFQTVGASSPWSFRDDFNYSSIGQLQSAGWTTESIAPSSYYSLGNSLLTLLNDGTVGAGAGYSNIPANVSDWSVSTRVDWIGSSGGVYGSVGSLQIAVGTAGHSYDWMADGYYGQFALGMDGGGLATFGSYTPQLNVFHVLRLDLIHGTLYGYFDGSFIGSFSVPNPGNTSLTSIQVLASWETNNSFDWVQGNNAPTPPSIFSVSVNPTSMTLISGQSGSLNATIGSQGSFSGTVNLTATISPSGPLARISPSSIILSSGSSTTAILTVSTQTSTQFGTYTITVTGVSGNTSRSALITLTVNSVSADFSITDSTTMVSIPVGSERQTIVDVTSTNGFSGNVTLVAKPSSNAIACWFTYTLTSTAVVYVPPNGSAYQYPTCGAYGVGGNYTVTFTATAVSISHSVVLQVTLIDFGLSASPISFPALSSGNGTLTLTSLFGLSGTVSLKTSAPSKLNVSCPSSALLAFGGNRTLSCSYSSGYPGRYNVTITGSFTCSDCYYNGVDSHSTTVTVNVSQPNHPEFYVSAYPNSLTARPGSTANSTISVTSLGGFTGTVGLAASVSPAGPSAAFSPVSISVSSGGNGTSILTISTTATSLTGIYTINVTATGGNLSHLITLSLTISIQDFTLTENPTSQVIPLASEMQTYITVTSISGFGGDVNLVATPSSSAIACWFAYTLTNTATVYVPPAGEADQYPTCGAYGAAGSYTVTFTATSGSVSHSLVLPVTIDDFSISASPVSFPAPQSTSGSVTLTSLSGLSGQINLAVSAPSQVTVSCPSTVNLAPGGTTIVSCSYTSTTPGTYHVIITGSFVCSGCYYDGTDSHSVSPTVTVSQPNRPDFYASANPNGLAISPGSSANSTISLTSLGGFTGTVNLAASISPSGPSVTLNPASIILSSGGTGTSILIVSTSSSTPTRPYTINVTETSGTLFHSLALTLSVSTSGFTITESPTSQQIPLASEKQTYITVDSINGFSGNVDLVATPSSTAVACWFAYTLTNTATVYVPANGYADQYPTCGAYGPSGSYTVTITGKSSSLRYSIVLPVTVMDYSISMSSVSFTPGSAGNGTATLTSLSGLFGSVSLSATSSPGLSVLCPPSVILPSSGSVSVLCKFSSTTAGPYNATITGTFVCNDCYYDGTDSHSATTTVNVTKIDPPFVAVGGAIVPVDRLLLLAPYAMFAALAVALAAGLRLLPRRRTKDAAIDF